MNRRDMMKRSLAAIVGLAAGHDLKPDRLQGEGKPMSLLNSPDLGGGLSLWEDTDRLRRFSRSGKALEDACEAADLPRRQLNGLAELLRRPRVVNHHELLLATKDRLIQKEQTDRIYGMVSRRDGLDIAGSAGWGDQSSFVNTVVPHFFGSDCCDFGWCSQTSCHYHFGERKRDDPRVKTHQDNDDIRHRFLDPGEPLLLGDFRLPSVGFAWAYKSREGFPEDEARLVRVRIRRGVTSPVCGRYTETRLCKAHPASEWDKRLLDQGRVPTGVFLGGGERMALVPLPFLTLHRCHLFTGNKPWLGVFAMELHPGTGHFVSLRYSVLSMEADLVGGPRECRLLMKVLEQYR